MAKPFTTWTVLPHEPIEKLADNLWRVTGKMPGGKVQRQMVLARMKDGRVLVNNAIAMADDEMRQLEAWGDPSLMLVPNGYHRQDAAIWKQRYPKTKVIAPAPGRKRIAQVVAIDVDATEAPHDDTVRLIPLDGVPGEQALEVRSGDQVTLTFTDVVMNMPKLSGVFGFLLAPTGKVATPRLTRWMAVKDRAALAAHLDKLAATPGLTRVLVGHGKPITDDPAGALRSVVAQLRG